MLDFGWSEFFLIILLAIVLMGPKDIPEIIYNLGRIVRRAQYMKFALSKQFDTFMEQMDLHDLKRGSGIADMAPRNIARNMMTPVPDAGVPNEKQDSDPAAEMDDDEAFYAETQQDHEQSADSSNTKQHQSVG